MKFSSINPYNGALLQEYEAHTPGDVDAMIAAAQQSFNDWRTRTIQERCNYIETVAARLLERADEYAQLMTLEMGKPIAQAKAEIKKCAWVCEYYATHAAEFLADEHITSNASRSYVRHQPLGCIFGIMPWNFPFWQVFRFAVPTLLAGNTVILKHAPNVLGCAKLIEESFWPGGDGSQVYYNTIISPEHVAQIIAHPAVKAVSLTGSSRAGSAVAALSGRHLKKCVLELGGSNAFIVLKDADVANAVSLAVQARMLNSGQSCIAAKRFIIATEIYEAFRGAFVEELKSLINGPRDPLDQTTLIGPLAREDLAINLQRQIIESVAAGAKLTLGGSRLGCYHEPTILEDVQPGMAAFDEETFGPLACFTRANSEADACTLAAQTNFGLGVTVFGSDPQKALALADGLADGAVFINDMVKSDPRLPFGGTNNSGYGRELSRDGMMEFVNRQTIYVK